MFAQPKFLRLKNGDTLAWDEYGDLQGRPVLFFHGWPASRLQGAGLGPAAEALGLRLICPDRPGIGLSTLRRGRTLLDWLPVVTELADQLGLERFRVLGFSGGGPYALVTAWGLPERVERAATVSGAPPLATGGRGRGELLAIYRLLLGIKQHAPELLRWSFRLVRPVARLRPPLWLIKLLLRSGSPADFEALMVPEVFAGSFACYQESWRGSGLGVALDGEIYATEWGFSPAEIQPPVTIWHGREDSSFHWKRAEALAAALPYGRFEVTEGDGHYSLPLRHGRRILEDLAQ